MSQGPIYNYPFVCCDHCGCEDDDRVGHDDTCVHGCNDEALEAEQPILSDPSVKVTP